MSITPSAAPALSPAEAAVQLAEKEAFAIGFHAYIWGYVYVKSMLLRDEAIHPDYKAYAPLNALQVHTTLAKPGFTDFTPNNDTLYGLGWLDVGPGPVLMQVPKIEGRYWTVQATDAALQCADYVGSRMGSKPGSYAYCKSGWQGVFPAGVTRIDVPTDTVFIQLRTLVRPEVPGDIEAVAELNRAFRFEASYKTAEQAPAHTPPRSAKNDAPHFHTLAFFSLLNEAVTRDNIIPGEAAVVAQFATLGIGPGLSFDPAKLSQAQQSGLQAGIKAGFARLAAYLMAGGEQLGGWRFVYRLGAYGHDFLARGATACFGYGANLPAEAAYPFTVVDGQGRPMDGGGRYSLHFDKAQLPPVDAFWSITMYTRPSNQLVENAIDRYNVSSETAGLHYNADGSLDICIQHAEPDDAKLRANWLPAPSGAFWVIMRLYQPHASVLNKQYAPPAVQRIDN